MWVEVGAGGEFAIVDDLKGVAWINLSLGEIMLFDHQDRRHIRATRVADIIFLCLVLAALGYAVSTHGENTQAITDLIGVSSARAVQQPPALRAIEYFPASYVNQAKDVQEHIQAF